MSLVPSWNQHGFPGFDFPFSQDIFGGLSYSAQRKSIRVKLVDGRSYVLRYSQALDAFPKLDKFIDKNNGQIYVDKLAAEFAHKYCGYRWMERGRVAKCLTDLFRALRYSRGMVGDFRELVMQDLRESLGMDLTYSSALGLVNCRRRFNILAYFAKKTDSIILASVIAHFLQENQEGFVGRENHRDLGAWGLAYMNIHDLLGRALADSCLRALALRFDDIRNSFRYMEYRDHRFEQLIHLMEGAIGLHARPSYVDPEWDYRGRRSARHIPFDPFPPRARTMPPPLLRLPQYILPSPVHQFHYPSTPPMELALHHGYQPGHVDHEQKFIETVVDNQNDLNQRVEGLERAFPMLLMS